MPNISRTIPGLFGGVSQQFPAMRHPTQGDLQLNALATVVDGLYKRPGTTHVGFTGLSWASTEPLTGNAFIHVIDRGDGQRWGLQLNGAGIQMVNMTTGATEATTILNDAGYLTSADPINSFRCVTVADTTFIVNTGTTVLAGSVDGYAHATNKAYVYLKTAAPQQSYYVAVNGNTATFTSGTSTTVDAVQTGLLAQLNGLAGVVATGSIGGVMGLIEVTATAASVAVSDTFGNGQMAVITNGVQKFSDLPPRYPTGVRVQIRGSGPNVDPYWVNFVGTQWVECLAPGMTMGLTDSYMPHKLTKTGAGGSWEFQRITWTGRLVGDNDTNPQPSFVGRTLRDIFFHRNRLGFLAGDSVALSRAGLYFNFYSSTATDVLDTDPIDLGGTSESIDTLDWAVPFNEELIIWATSKQQFALASGDVLSPKTAKLQATTAFASNNSARPRQLGNRIVYANSMQGHAQLGLYKVAKDTVSNTTDSITENTPTYIHDAPKSIEVSEAAHILAVVPSGPSAKSLFVFKYEDDGDKLTQRAWQEFSFGCDSILKAHWSASKLYLFCYYRDSSVSGGIPQDSVALEVLDFDTSTVDAGAVIAMRLDRKVVPSVSKDVPVLGQTTLTVPFRFLGNPTVLQSAAGYTREFPVVSVARGNTSTVVVVQGTWNGGSVLVGSKYTMRYRFTEVFLRDSDGIPVMSAKVKLVKMLVRHIRTGFFRALVSTKAGGAYSYVFTGQGVGFGLGLGNGPTLVDGDFQVPVHAQAGGTTITLESDSFLPCQFPYAEWVGAVTMKARR